MKNLWSGTKTIISHKSSNSSSINKIKDKEGNVTSEPGRISNIFNDFFVNVADDITKTKTVKLLGVTLDYRLDFDPHISNICKKAAAQLNVLKRFKAFIGFKEKQILIQSFVYSNFNYCPLVWYFSSSKSLQKIEKIQERALRSLYNDHTSSYDDLLLK